MNRYATFFKAYKNEMGLAQHQLASFNNFIDNKLQKIVDEIGEIELETPEIAEFKIKLGKIRVPEPVIKEADGAVNKVTPMEARTRDLTYASPIIVEMIPMVNGVEQETHEVTIGKIPIMVKSNKCVLKGKDKEELSEMGEDPEDPGGYFIINGTERILMIMEEILPDRPIVERRRGVETARINSEQKGYVQRHLLERKKGVIKISYANMKSLPLVVLLRALGLETDKELLSAVTEDEQEAEEMYFNLYEYPVETVEDAREFIGKKLNIPQKEYREKRLKDMMDKYLLPHLGQDKKDRKKKALYLAKVARKLIRLGLNKIEEQDIDHYANKRLKLGGDLLEILLRSVLLGKYGLINRITYRYQKLAKKGKIPALESIVENDYLTKRIISHMATGQWVGGRTGVCQRLERTNYIRTLSHLRNVLSPLSSSQEHFKARALHTTQWGRLCAEKTPEGVNIGLRKYLATLTIISTQTEEDKLSPIKDILNEYDKGDWTVFLNGNVMKSIKKCKSFVNKIRGKRRLGLISPHVNIAYDDKFNEIYINADSGRLQRPVILVEKGKPKLKEKHVEKLENGELSWSDLVKQGIIEYLDAHEEENAYVALNEDDVTDEHTHVEIDPSIILGLSASLVPYPEHDRGDRVNFGAKMSGQSLGTYSTNFLSRTESRANILTYPQVPIVNTTIGKRIGMDHHPQGQNVVIALLAQDGYNMEDGIVIKRSAIDRGLAYSTFFRTYTTEEQKYWGIEKDEIKIPDKSVSGYKTEEAYINLAEDGVINREANVGSGDVLVGKVSPLRFFGPMENFMMESENRRETSETVRHGEKGIVDNVIVSETSDGNKLVKVVVRTPKPPEIGDKFASRHGQKGVVARVVDEEDLPFNKDGITPDVILNPHAIPSRMTVGQLLEILASKLGALRGEIVNASIFSGMKEDSVRDALKKFGFRDDGKETFYHGITGKEMKAKVLAGPCYYQKLHHMVSNKIHSRSRGPVTLLTKQPTAGKAKQGGLRLGEMEKDCLIAHGASLLLKERFSADAYDIPVCEECGHVAVEDKNKGRVYCPLCDKSQVKKQKMSYAFKLMLDELKCMGLETKIHVRDETE